MYIVNYKILLFNFTFNNNIRQYYFLNFKIYIILCIYFTLIYIIKPYVITVFLHKVFNKLINLILILSYFPKVATMTAFIVCILFSASSNTNECSLSNTSLVTSIQSNPYLLYICSPTLVLVS